MLVVDDEPIVREVIGRYLEHAGFHVDAAGDGETALEKIGEHAPDAILLDLMLPRLDGLDLLRVLRLDSSVPVIVLSARSSERERVAGLELGADDYVVKPYSPSEVVARLRAVLRRANGTGPDQCLWFDGLEIDPVRRVVSNRGSVVPLTRKEFELLHLLASNPGRVFSRDQLVELVWGYVWTGDTSTVTVHVRRLRAKLEDDPARPRRLVTVWGIGYRFDR